MKWMNARVYAWVCIVSITLLAGAPARTQESKMDTTEYTFTDENIVGELPGMENVSITVRGTGKEKSLIRVKTHFVREMLKSVETM